MWTTLLGSIQARCLALAMSAGMAVLAAGCAPQVGVKRLPPRDVGRSFTSNVLSADDLSDATRIALRRYDLTELFDNQPAVALAQLHAIVLSEGAPNDDLFALAEASFFYAGRGGKQPYYLAAAVYSFAFLFPEDATQQPVAMDPRYRWACDIYDRALTLGFKSANGDNLEPAPVGEPYRKLARAARHCRWISALHVTGTL